MDMEGPQEPCTVASDTPAETSVEEPASAEPSPQRRTSACGEFTRMTDALGSIVPIPAVNMPNEPAPGPRFFRGMSYEGLHTLCKQRGHPHRDARALLITRLLAMDQLD